jgi:cytochrome c nitrite reductase small subunit
MPTDPTLPAEGGEAPLTVSERTKRILRIVAIAGPFLFVGSMFLAAEATKSNTFCGLQCHEMRPYYQTWASSEHREVECVGCHIPDGALNYVKTKLFGLRELWVHITDQVEKPIAVTRRISSDTCSGCHRSEDVAGRIRLARWTIGFSHPDHTKGMACIDCHARVVHPTIEGVPNTPARSMEACFTCHDGQSQPDECEYCHDSAPHPERGACEECHGLKSWSSGIRHSPRLTGKHETILCERCHGEATATRIGRPTGCIDCHRPAHALQLGVLSLRKCADCHTITRWRPTTFDHPRNDCVSCHGNEHESPSLAQCQECHSQTTWSGARHPDRDCTACHAPGRMHAGLGSSCQSCHVSGAYWSPSTFRHPQVGEHIPGGEHRLTCTACHTTTYASATCTPCHGPGGVDDD